LGILKGVLIGAILSIMLLLRRASRPHVAVLGRVPGSNSFGDIDPNPENEVTSGVLIFRVDSSILYFNVEYVRERFLEALDRQTPPVKCAIWCLGTTPHVDLAGAEALEQLCSELKDRGIELVLAEARGPLREQLRAAGLERHFGAIRENSAIAPIVQRWLASTTA
jgi:MFS superfamily sulfate permease-like transporter